MEPYVRVFDTTLRDGEQSPGASLTPTEKSVVAQALSRLGVDIIEAGFPAASPDDLMAVRTIAEVVGTHVPEGRPVSQPPTICGLARASKRDIDRAWQAVAAADYPRIHTFLATSPIHREFKLRMSKHDVVQRAGEMVGYACTLCSDVEFSPEDAGRTEPEFLYEVLAAAIEAGATTVNIPDTVGYTTPQEFGALISGIRANVRGIDRAVISVHCHDDLGLATANTLAGIEGGARQAEVTINGIGERAGNTSLEEVVMALLSRKAHFGLYTGIDTTQLTRTSRLVSNSTGIVVQPNKAIVGANAFAHEAGIHQDGMLKNEQTYEIMRPETVGAGHSRLVLGKHSGRHAFGARLAELGYELSGDELDAAFIEFKILADKKKMVTDADLVALIAGEVQQPETHYALGVLDVSCGTGGLSTSTVSLRGPAGEAHRNTASGHGPIDAVFRSIQQLVKAPVTPLEYNVQSVTEGVDALAQVNVRLRAESLDGRVDPQRGEASAPTFHGYGVDTDVIVASAKAYLAALNRLFIARPASRPEDANVAAVAKAAT